MDTAPKRTALLITAAAILLVAVAAVFAVNHFRQTAPREKPATTAIQLKAPVVPPSPAGRMWDAMAGLAYLDLHGADIAPDKTPAEYARALGADPEKLLHEVSQRVFLVPYEGSAMEPPQMFEGGMANSLDRARLLRALLTASGTQARIVSLRQDGKLAVATYASSPAAALPPVKTEVVSAVEKEVAERSPAILSRLNEGAKWAASLVAAKEEQRLYWVQYQRSGQWTDLIADDMKVDSGQRASAAVLSDDAEARLAWQLKLTVTNLWTGDPAGKGKEALSFSARASDLNAVPVTFFNRPDGSLTRFVPTLLAGDKKVEGPGFAWSDAGKELRGQVLKIDVAGPVESRHFTRVLVGERGSASEPERGLEIATSAHLTVVTGAVSDAQFERVIAGNLSQAAKLLYRKSAPGQTPEPANVASVPAIAILDASHRYAGRMGDASKQLLAFQGRPALALDRDFVEVSGDSLVRRHSFDLMDPGHSLHGSNVSREILLRAAVEQSVIDALLEDWMAAGQNIVTSRRALGDWVTAGAEFSADRPPAAPAAEDFGRLHPVYRIAHGQNSVSAGWRLDPGPQIVPVLGDGSGGTISTSEQRARLQNMCTVLSWGSMLVPAQIFPPNFLLGGIVSYDCKLAEAYHKAADVLDNLAKQIGGEAPSSSTTPGDVEKQIKEMTDGLIKDIVKDSIGSAVAGLAVHGATHVISSVVDSVLRPLAGAAGDYIASKIGGGLGKEILSEAEAAACKEATQLVEKLEQAGWAREDIEKFMQNYGCFGRGTLVHTPSGPRPIESLHAGEMVIARNSETGAIEPRRIEATSVHNATECLRVTLSDGEQLEVTPNHLFYLPERQAWAPAAAFAHGTVLFSSSTASATVLEFHSQACTTETYDLRIAGDHTYFVSRSGILVHNSGEDCSGGKEMAQMVEQALQEGKSQAEISKMVEEKFGSAETHESHLEMDAKLSKELEKLREEVGPKVEDGKITGGTVGVAGSDIPGLQGKTYEGKSGSLHEEWPWKNSEFFSENERSQNHAEEDLANQLDRDLKATGKAPHEIEGVIKIQVDQAVCSGCRAGLNNPSVDLGPLGKFSAKYPNVEIQVSNSTNGEVLHIIGGALTGH